MPAINSLTTIPKVASPIGNVTNNTLPIISIHNSTNTLSKEQTVNNFAQDIAYSAHSGRKTREVTHISDITHGTPTVKNCNLANRIDIHLHHLEDDTGLKFPRRKELSDYYNSPECRRTLNSKRRFKPENGD
jgi:hypothetical protein